MANNGFEAIKFPVFLPELDPDLWMAQMETAFQARKINCPVQKYNYLLSSLNEEAAKEVRNLILHPPIIQNYTQIPADHVYKEEKQKLLQRLRAPITRRLLKPEQMGEQTPSKFLAHLKQVAGPGADENIVKTQWINKLPKRMQGILKDRNQESIESIGRLADFIVGIVNDAAAEAAANQQSQQQAVSQSPRMTEDDQLTNEQTLLRRVEAMKVQFAEFARSMDEQMEEVRLAVNALQNADQASARKEIVKPD